MDSIFAGVAVIDHLADAWRWWGVPGALLGLAASFPYAKELVVASLEGRDVAEPVVATKPRALAMIGGLLLMLFVAGAGTIIPLANDGRVAGFTRETLLYRGAMAVFWGAASAGCWAIALSFAHRWRYMAACSVVCWFAAYVASRALEGAAL